MVVESGDAVDLTKFRKMSNLVPNTRKFRVFRYQNPRTCRWIRVMKCDFKNCDMLFRKWHNFFDHLRSHTGERPFKCSYSGCYQSFTQNANLYKHNKLHKLYLRQKTICKKWGISVSGWFEVWCLTSSWNFW